MHLYPPAGTLPTGQVAHIPSVVHSCTSSCTNGNKMHATQLLTLQTHRSHSPTPQTPARQCDHHSHAMLPDRLRTPPQVHPAP